MNRYTRSTFGLEIILILAAAVFMIPMVTLVAVALRDPDATSSFLGFTWPLKFDNITTAWVESKMGPSILNSLFITLTAVALIILVASAASYVITRRTAKWSRGVFYLFLIGFLFPGQLALIPLYLMFAQMGLVGSPLPVILIAVGGSMPFAIFLYSAFLRDLPQDYEEAAAIDGAGPLRMFWSVVFPLLKPVTGTIAILCGLSVWNDFLHPLLYLSGGNNRTAPLSVYTFVGEYSANWPLVFSALMTSVVPLLVAYFLMQRYIIRGFASGIKG